MANFILVHGAWHGGWCWSRVASHLQLAGHHVLTPDLPGHGDDQTPATEVTMTAYGQCIVESANTCDGPVHLVGHSMGGLVISFAAEMAPEKFSQLIYLCAFVPNAGESLNAAGRNNTATALRGDVFESANDGAAITVKPEVIADLFYHDCDEAAIAMAHEKLVPQPVAAMAEKFQGTPERFGSVPKAYIECIEDKAIHIATQRAQIRDHNICKVATLNTSHSPFFSAPGTLADVLTQLAQ